MISIIVPAYNEAGNIKIVAGEIKRILEGAENFELIFVDDGSNDTTLSEIKTLAASENYVKYISFSRNFGHQKALKAGIDFTCGDCVISMDADLQHPPELITKLIEKWREGFDVVYTVRKDDTEVGYLKKITSKLFYHIINKLSDVHIPFGSADFRLLDRKVVDELKRFDENWIFIRGVISWLGFRQIGIEYTPHHRYSGETKYSFPKMISFAIQGIMSFSIMPLRIATILGVFISLGSFLYAIYAVFIHTFTDEAIKGWTSILISVLFLGGIQLISLGLIGEYLGKMFIETKNRPSYVIKEKSL